MMKAYRDTLTKNALSLFSSGSSIIKSISDLGEGIFFVEFLYKEEFPEDVEKKYDINEIKWILEQLWVFSSELSPNVIELSNPNRMVIWEDYFDKLDLLNKILHGKNQKSNIDRLSRILEFNHFDIKAINSIIDIDDKDIAFNDAQIYLYAIYNKYPHKIDLLQEYINHDRSIKYWEKPKIDKRTIKKWVQLNNLTLSLNWERNLIDIYDKDKKYQSISWEEIKFTTKNWRINKKALLFIKLVKWEKVTTDEKNRKLVSKINWSFKEILNIDEPIISSKGNQWFYQLHIWIKYKTGDDILDNPWRYRELYENDLDGHENKDQINKVLNQHID